jgi:hypothetical protein
MTILPLEQLLHVYALQKKKTWNTQELLTEMNSEIIRHLYIHDDLTVPIPCDDSPYFGRK